MDKKKQSILKQEGRIPLQEMGLPDFPDEDTGTVTVTKSRRVSFGANFVKEFIVGSAISTQCYSEYEQAFSSSDSSNPNSSHSGLLNQSSGLDNAINLCVKPTVEEEFIQVKKKLCLEKQQDTLIVNEKCIDKNWDFNVSSNSNIFAEKCKTGNKSENFKHTTKGIKKPSHNDSFVPGEKYFQNKQTDPELNTSKFNDNLEKKNKPGKFSSTICFSVDSPTADMEFTEGCINLAKSIFDKKNKEMTVYIQEKKGNEKKEGKTNSGDIIFDGSQVEMSLTKCVHDQSEDDSFLGNKLSNFKHPTSGIQSNVSDESHEDIENIPMHMYPLNILLNHNNKLEEDSELERSLFFPERSLTEMLNPEPVKTSDFIDESLEKDNNEECNMELSICEPFKVCTTKNLLPDKNIGECTPELLNSEPLKIYQSNAGSLKRDSNEKCTIKLPSSGDIKILTSDNILPNSANDGESDMELSICEPFKTYASNNPTAETDHNEGSDMELSICEPLKTHVFSNSIIGKDNNEESDMELSICEPLETYASSNPAAEKNNNENPDMEMSVCGAAKTPVSNTFTLEKDSNKNPDMELSVCGAAKTPVFNTFTLEKDSNKNPDMEISVCGPAKTPVFNTFRLEKDSNENPDMELSVCGPAKTPVFNTFTLEKDSNENPDMELSVCGPAKTPVFNTFTLEKDSNENSDMELSVCEPVKTPVFNTFTLEKDTNENPDMELSVCEPVKTPVFNTFTLEKDTNENPDVELSVCEPVKTPVFNTFTLEKHNSGDGDMISAELLKIPMSNDTFPEKENIEDCKMKLLISGALATAVSKNCAQVKKKNCKDYNIDLSPCENQKISAFPLDEDSNEECKMELPNPEPFNMFPSDHSLMDNDNNEECIMELSTSEPVPLLVPDNSSMINENNEECNVELSICEPLKLSMTCTPTLVDGNNEECNMELPTSQPSEIHVSTESSPDSNNIEVCRTDLLPCGHLQMSASDDNSLKNDNNEGCNIKLLTSEPLEILTYKNCGNVYNSENKEQTVNTKESTKQEENDEVGNSVNKCNAEDKKEKTVHTVEDTEREEKNKTENCSGENEYLRCSFMHVDLEAIGDNNMEADIKTCGIDPLSVSLCEEDISLNGDKNEKSDAEMTDVSSLKIFKYDQSLRKESDQGEKNDEIANCSKDSSFSEVMKEAVEEVTNGSFIKKSVIDFFRSTVTDTDASLNENFNSKNKQSPLKMQFGLESPVKVQDQEKSQKSSKIAGEMRTSDSVSEGDKKIIALLKEQAQETNCLWKIESFAHKGDCHCWSFSSSLLGNPVIMMFRLMPPKDTSVVSFSSILERNIELLKLKEFQPEKNKTTIKFAFEKMKNYFDSESRSLDNVHKISLFLDRMNYFMTRINKVVDQLVRIMKEYPGSRLTKSILSFRLHSFPLMFSLSVMVDVNDPLQLSESSVTFEKHFGNFSTAHIKSVFNDCLKSDEVLIQFIQRLVQLIISEERLRGCITNRSYIRLVTQI